MGEYFRIVNLDERQYFAGHALGLSGKFTSLQDQPMSALLVWVLARPNWIDKPIYRGSWDGDRVVIAGDEGEHQGVFDQSDSFQDISLPLIEEWIDHDVFVAMKYWNAGMVDDDGKFVLDSMIRRDEAERRKDAEFPFGKWEARHGV